MAARAYWKGYLRLSLVSCPIQLFPAASERQKIRFHQINKKTGHRIKYCRLDSETGQEVDPKDIILGYEVAKGQYIEVTDDELEAVAIEGTHTIEIDQFVRRSEIDDRYLSRPYYLAPNGDIGQQPFAVIREAMKREDLVALGRVILTTREHVLAIEPLGKGLLGVTLRYPYEIREDRHYFGDLSDEKVPKEMIDLASHIVKTKIGHFNPERFEDHYEHALRELIKRKQRGEKIDKPRTRPSPNVINLMDALRQSAASQRNSGRRSRATPEKKRASVRQPGVRRRKAS